MIYDLEAEACVLGTLFGPCYVPQHTATVLDHLTEADFGDPRNRIVFRTIMAALDAGDDLSHPLTLIHRLRTSGNLDKVPTTYLADLLYQAPTSGMGIAHAPFVKWAARQREWGELASQEPMTEDELEQMTEDATSLLAELKRKTITRPTSVGELIGPHLETLEAHESIGFHTGLSKMDDRLGALIPGQLVIIGGRTSIGKTALLAQVALSAARQGFPTLFESLEMSKLEMMNRVLAQETGISVQTLHLRNLSEDEHARTSRASAEIAQLPLKIDAGIGEMTPTRLAARLRQVPDAAVLVVDYVQLMHSDRKAENRTQEIGEVTRALKALAVERNVVVIAGSQLSRQMESGDKVRRPQLRDLRESGSLEQDADIVVLLHRPKDQPFQTAIEQELIVAKNRHGATGHFNVIFHAGPNTFEVV